MRTATKCNTTYGPELRTGLHGIKWAGMGRCFAETLALSVGSEADVLRNRRLPVTPYLFPYGGVVLGKARQASVGSERMSGRSARRFVASRLVYVLAL